MSSSENACSEPFPLVLRRELAQQVEGLVPDAHRRGIGREYEDNGAQGAQERKSYGQRNHGS